MSMLIYMPLSVSLVLHQLNDGKQLTCYRDSFMATDDMSSWCRHPYMPADQDCSNIPEVPPHGWHVWILKYATLKFMFY